MNCTKIIPPLPIFTDFYFYYSYFTLFITVGITPIQYYVIFTQSKNLTSFKWLVLNHSFWCTLFEILFTTIKPVFLAPAFSGYPIGLLKYGSLKLTGIATFAIFNILAISIGALGATLISRYLLVFPASNWFHKNHAIIFIATVITIIGAIFCIIFYKFLSIDTSTYYEMAVKYDSCMQNYYSAVQGYIFFPYENASIAAFIVCGLLIAIIILATCIIIYFIYLVKTNVTVSTTKLSSSLMISAVAQLLITAIFNFVPVLAFVAILAFQIPNTENIMIIIFCTISIHAFLESVATLYLITPYRTYILSKFRYRWQKIRINVAKISRVNTF